MGLSSPEGRLPRSGGEGVDDASHARDGAAAGLVEVKHSLKKENRQSTKEDFKVQLCKKFTNGLSKNL